MGKRKHVTKTPPTRKTRKGKAATDPLVAAVETFPPLDEIDRDEVQPSLIPMTEDDVLVAGRKLATKVRELEDMSADHALKRTEMSNARDALREEIGNIAQTIRQQGR